jgi:hypothetical protein
MKFGTFLLLKAKEGCTILQTSAEQIYPKFDREGACTWTERDIGVPSSFVTARLPITLSRLLALTSQVTPRSSRMVSESFHTLVLVVPKGSGMPVAQL